MTDRSRPIGCFLALSVAISATAACGRQQAATSGDPLQRGKALIQRMSDMLAAAPGFSVTTEESREVLDARGQSSTIALTRQTVVRRPDRLYFSTSGDKHHEAWYDGVGFTLASHGEKAFAQSRMPETLDRTLDALTERYGIQIPLADLIYSNPAKALIAETTTGGWVARETVDGQPVEHLKFQDTGVNWEVWIAADGNPLPRRAAAEFPAQKRVRKVAVRFRDWTLAPSIAADRFDAHVPPDYEGIAMIQRAAVLRNAKDEPAPTQGEKK